LKATNEDFYGNNAAFCCPLCSKVFIVRPLEQDEWKEMAELRQIDGPRQR